MLEMRMTENKAEALARLLTEEDGDLLVTIPTIEALSVGHSLVYAVSGGRVDFTLLSRLFGGLQRLLGRKDEADTMGVGGTVAVTSAGLVMFENDHKRVPRKRLGRFNGYDKVGSLTNPDLLILQLDNATFRVQPLQRESLVKLKQVMAAASGEA